MTQEQGQPPELISTGAAAKALGIDPSTLVRWSTSGVVTPAGRTVGGHLRWNLEQLRAQLAEAGASPS